MQTTNTNNNVSVSITKGVTFAFEDQGKEIEVTCSLFSGKQTIYVNGKQVFSTHSFRLKSCQSFTSDNEDYEVELELENLLTHKIRCTLIKNGAHLKTQHFGLLSTKYALMIFMMFFVGGALSGFITSRFIIG